jgi:hypothetical protein
MIRRRVDFGPTGRSLAPRLGDVKVDIAQHVQGPDHLFTPDSSISDMGQTSILVRRITLDDQGVVLGRLLTGTGRLLPGRYLAVGSLLPDGDATFTKIWSSEASGALPYRAAVRAWRCGSHEPGGR